MPFGMELLSHLLLRQQQQQPIIAAACWKQNIQSRKVLQDGNGGLAQLLQLRGRASMPPLNTFKRNIFANTKHRSPQLCRRKPLLRGLLQERSGNLRASAKSDTSHHLQRRALAADRAIERCYPPACCDACARIGPHPKLSTKDGSAFLICTRLRRPRRVGLPAPAPSVAVTPQSPVPW